MAQTTAGTSMVPSSTTQGTANDSSKQRWDDFEASYKKELSQPIATAYTLAGGADFLSKATQLQTKNAPKHPPSFLHDLDAVVARLEKFTGLVDKQTLPDGAAKKSCAVWSILAQVLEGVVELPKANSAIMADVVHALDEMSHNLQLFQLYQGLLGVVVDQSDLAAAALVDFLQFWVGFISYLRNNRYLSKLRPDWRVGLDETSQRTRRRITQAEELARALAFKHVRQANATQVELEHQFEQLNVGLSTGDAIALVDARIMKDPCNTLHLPSNPRFTGRKTYMTKVQTELDDQPSNPKFRSMAIWGMPGVGKTQMALAYAYDRVAKRTPAVFWVNAETTIELAKSYTQIARQLQLEGIVETGPPERNRSLVNNWLRKTSVPWLMVFDNVENPGDLRSWWPIASPNTRGSILITSRNDILAADPAAGGLELKCFDKAEGKEFLLAAIGRGTYSPGDDVSAAELNGLLGGLPLALNLMGGQIRSTRAGIPAFVTRYQQDVERRLHTKPRNGVQNSYYPHALDTAFSTSFDPLEADSISIMAVLALLHPDDIPQDMFTTLDSSKSPAALKFCEAPFACDDALLPMFSASMLSKDPQTELISVHRLLQDEFCRWLGAQRRETYFLAGAQLLVNLFPRQINGQTLRGQTEQCRKFIQHALALSARQQQYKIAKDALAKLESFVELMTNCAWYLIELGDFDLCLNVVATAKSVCPNQNTLWYAHLCNSAGLVYNERVNSKEALQQYTICKDIREALLPPDHQELANIYGNLATVMPMYPGTEQALEECKELLLKALKIELGKPTEESVKNIFIRYQNLGLVLALLKQYEDGTRYILLGRETARKAFGMDVHWEAKASYKLGYIEFEQQHYDKAKEHFDAAFTGFNSLNPTLPATTAAQYKSACCDIEAGLLPSAIQQLRVALKACEVNEHRKGDKGDIARTSRKLAHALQLAGEDAEAESLRTQAESYRKAIQGDKFDSLPDEDRSYDLLIYWTYW